MEIRRYRGSFDHQCAVWLK